MPLVRRTPRSVECGFVELLAVRVSFLGGNGRLDEQNLGAGQGKPGAHQAQPRQ
jgi:hypothetical protein